LPGVVESRIEAGRRMKERRGGPKKKNEEFDSKYEGRGRCYLR